MVGHVNFVAPLLDENPSEHLKRWVTVKIDTLNHYIATHNMRSEMHLFINFFANATQKSFLSMHYLIINM